MAKTPLPLHWAAKGGLKGGKARWCPFIIHGRVIPIAKSAAAGAI